MHWCERYVLAEGSQGYCVRVMQSRLDNYLGDSQHLARDGIFGWRTRNAVYWFQRDHGLTPDCIVGPATWRALRNY